MQKFHRVFGVCILALMVGILTLLSPNVSYAHSLSSQPHLKQVITANITEHGHTQIFRVASGQETIIPAKNGGSIHFSMGFIPAKSNTSDRIIPNGSIPIGGCGTAIGSVSYYDVLGIQLSYYSLQEFFCNNGVAVTIQETPTKSSKTFVGITLANHNESNGWLQKPWSAYALGTYDFLTGIPTPWGGVGSNCDGSINIHMVGDGPYYAYLNNCI